MAKREHNNFNTVRAWGSFKKRGIAARRVIFTQKVAVFNLMSSTKSQGQELRGSGQIWSTARY